MPNRHDLPLNTANSVVTGDCGFREDGFEPNGLPGMQGPDDSTRGGAGGTRGDEARANLYRLSKDLEWDTQRKTEPVRPVRSCAGTGFVDNC